MREPNHNFIQANPEEVLCPAEHAVHKNFTTSVGALRKDLVRTAYYLLQVQERDIHRKLGYETLAAYAAAWAGLTAKQAREFVAIARRLPQFQEVEEALKAGDLSWSKARLITRRANPEDQRKWIDQAQKIPVRELEERLPPRAKQPPAPTPAPAGLLAPKERKPAAGDPPSAPKQHFTLSFTAEEYALLEAAYCDAVIEDTGGNRRRTIPPRLRRQVMQRARFRWEAAGCPNTQFLQIHHRRPAAAGGGNTLDNLVVLCSRCHRRLHENEQTARTVLRHAP